MANFKICLYLALCGIALISSNANECFEENKAYPGNDLGPVNKMQASSAEECQKLCQNTYGCLVFTFRAKNEGCWLKNIKSEGETSAGAISGNVICEDICQFGVGYIDGNIQNPYASTQRDMPSATTEQVCAKMVLEAYPAAKGATFLNHHGGQYKDGTFAENECWGHFGSEIKDHTSWTTMTTASASLIQHHESSPT